MFGARLRGRRRSRARLFDGLAHSLFRHGDDYALYVCPLQFGYAKAIEFNTYINQASNRKVVDIRFLAGNSVGVTPDGRPRSVKDPLTLNWKPVKEEFYRSIEEALVVVRGQRSGTGRGRTPWATSWPWGSHAR